MAEVILSRPLGIFAMIQHGGKSGASLGIDPAANTFGPGQKLFGIERDALDMYAARGLVFQIGRDCGPIFLDRGGLHAALADLSEPVIIGCIWPQDGNAVCRHGILLSLLSRNATIAEAEGATILSGGGAC